MFYFCYITWHLHVMLLALFIQTLFACKMAEGWSKIKQGLRIQRESSHSASLGLVILTNLLVANEKLQTQARNLENCTEK